MQSRFWVEIAGWLMAGVIGGTCLAYLDYQLNRCRSKRYEVKRAALAKQLVTLLVALLTFSGCASSSSGVKFREQSPGDLYVCMHLDTNKELLECAAFETFDAQVKYTQRNTCVPVVPMPEEKIYKAEK